MWTFRFRESIKIEMMVLRFEVHFFVAFQQMLFTCNVYFPTRLSIPQTRSIFSIAITQATEIVSGT